MYKLLFILLLVLPNLIFAKKMISMRKHFNVRGNNHLSDLRCRCITKDNCSKLQCINPEGGYLSCDCYDYVEKSNSCTTVTGCTAIEE